MPQVAIGQRVIGRHLQIGGSTVIDFFYREGQSVYKDSSGAVGGNDTVTGNFLILFVSLHVLEAYPAGAPSGSV